MKILLLSHEYPPIGGGGGRIVCYLAQALAKNHEVHVLTSAVRGQSHEETSGGVFIHRTGLSWGINMETNNSAMVYASLASFLVSATVRGMLLCREHSIDILHSHFIVPSGVIGDLISFFSGTPHVATAVEADILDPRASCLKGYGNPMIRAAIRRVFRNARRSVSISEATKAEARREYGIGATVDVVYYGIPKPKFSIVSRESLGLKPGDFLTLFAGRLVPRKGVRHLIEAVAKINQPDVKAVIIGDGPQRGELAQLARSLHIEDQVLFTGFIPEEIKFQYMANCDLFALTSIHDGYSLVILEAMHCGLPIVSTDNGGHAELVEEGNNGFLIPPADGAALADRIMGIRKDPALQKRLGNYSRSKAEIYSPEATATAYEKIYRSL